MQINLSPLIVSFCAVVALACSSPVQDDPQPEATTPPTQATAAATPAQAVTAPQEASLTPEQGSALVEALRGGGYILLFRHALTDLSQGDDLSALLLAGNEGASRGSVDGLNPDCSKQRNLSQPGRDQARRLGVDFERLRIPHDTVLTSPFCRNLDTAALAFGHYRIEERLSLIVGADADGAAANEIRSLLRQRPAGTNTILISHLSNITAAGFNLIAEGESIVIKPEGSQWTVVAYVKADDWSQFR